MGGSSPSLQNWAGGLGPALGGFQMEMVGGSSHRGEAVQMGERREEAFARGAHSICSPLAIFLHGFQDSLFSPNEPFGFLSVPAMWALMGIQLQRPCLAMPLSLWPSFPPGRKEGGGGGCSLVGSCKICWKIAQAAPEANETSLLG